LNIYLYIDTENIEAGSYNVQESDIIANIGMYKTKGNFIIFTPGELHMPAIQINEPEDVIKVVMKVKI